MGDTDKPAKSGEACLVGAGVDLSGVAIVKVSSAPALRDYEAAMSLANTEAEL